MTLPGGEHQREEEAEAKNKHLLKIARVKILVAAKLLRGKISSSQKIFLRSVSVGVVLGNICALGLVQVQCLVVEDPLF